MFLLIWIAGNQIGVDILSSCASFTGAPERVFFTAVNSYVQNLFTKYYVSLGKIFGF